MSFARRPPNSHDEFLTVAEAAAYLRVNPQTVRNWIDQGSLRAVRVGPRRVRVNSRRPRARHRTGVRLGRGARVR
jgi:excisionase family DNA binding protein